MAWKRGLLVLGAACLCGGALLADVPAVEPDAVVMSTDLIPLPGNIERPKPPPDTRVCGPIMYQDLYKGSGYLIGVDDGGRVADECELIGEGRFVCEVFTEVYNLGAAAGTVIIELWDDCPPSCGGTGTLLAASDPFVVDPGGNDLTWVIEPNIEVEDIVWVGWHSPVGGGGADLGPLISEVAEIGFTQDIHAQETCGADPVPSCTCDWADLWSGFSARIRAQTEFGPGACCIDHPSGTPWCVMVEDRDTCELVLGGEYQGNGTPCGTPDDLLHYYESQGYEPLYIPDPGMVTDVIDPNSESCEVGKIWVDLCIHHPRISDLRIKLEHWGTEIVLWDRACLLGPDEDGMGVIFDDQGNDVVCATSTVGNINPNSCNGQALAAFIGVEVAGPWTLTVEDLAAGPGASYEPIVIHWSLHIWFLEDNPCVLPRGACCMVGEPCWITTREECEFFMEQGARYLGDFTTCDPDPCPCDAPCPPGGIPEGEPDCHTDYDDQYNTGCNVDPPILQPINCGELICGRAGNFDYHDPNDPNIVYHYRDVDAYGIVVDEWTTLTMTVYADFPVTASIDGELDPNRPCETEYTCASADADPCSELIVQACVPPGRYHLYVTPSVWEVLPCGPDTEYTFLLECAPCGRCCLPDQSCEMLTAEQCHMKAGNALWTPGETCDPIPCPGDTNCDGVIDFGDINPFVMALTDYQGWKDMYGCDDEVADVNGDGVIDFGDINPFVEVVITGSGPCPVVCPEFGACCIDAVGTETAWCVEMPEEECLAMAGTWIGGSCGYAHSEEYTWYSSPGLEVYDHLVDTIVVDESCEVGDVDIDIVLHHPRLSDLLIYIEHYDVIVVLWNGACPNGSYLSVIFDDEGNAVFCANPTMGSITPRSANGGWLSAFDGLEVYGDWTLHVVDNQQEFVGTLWHWSVHINFLAENPCWEPRGACCVPIGGQMFECQIMTEPECLAIPFAWYLGNYTVCTPDSCPPE